MNKRHYEHTLPNIRGSLSNTYIETETSPKTESRMTTKQACRFPDRKTVRTIPRHGRQKNGTGPSFVTKR